jgi:hypothetical protein
MKSLVRTILFSVLVAAPAIHVLSVDVLSDAPYTSDVNGVVSFVSGANGSITVSFPQQSATSVPRYDAATVVACNAGGEPAFAGNYTAMGVSAVSFKIRSEKTVSSPVLVQIVLRSSVSGRVWRNESVAASAVQGEWISNQVSFDRASGWKRDGSGDFDAMWAADLQSVEMIGVRLAQPGREAMSYTVAEFVITGSFGTTPGFLTPLEKALKDRFGVTAVSELTDAQKTADADADGMTDVAEILSENDQDYANSIFVAEIVSVTDAGVLVKWACVAGSRYTVIRGDSLMDEFQDLPGAVSLPATSTGFMTYLDTTGVNGGPYFYKMRREP